MSPMGVPMHRDLYYGSHLSPVNCFLQQRDHILALTARCLEAFCPLEEDALEENKQINNAQVHKEEHQKGDTGHSWSPTLQTDYPQMTLCLSLQY